MVEQSASALAGLGHDPAMIFTERFGPTGGKRRAACVSSRRSSIQPPTNRRRQPRPTHVHILVA